MEFLDVPGASGARYRFRRVQTSELPVNAGNVIAVTGVPPGRRYLLCGAARSLNRAQQAVEAAVRAAGDVELYIRLNVARATREAEHADIVAAVRPESDLPDLG